MMNPMDAKSVIWTALVSLAERSTEMNSTEIKELSLKVSDAMESLRTSTATDISTAKANGLRIGTYLIGAMKVANRAGNPDLAVACRAGASRINRLLNEM